MTPFKLGQKLSSWLQRQQNRVDSALILLSILALGLVVASEFISPNAHVLSLGWPDLQVCLRTVIWLVFVVNFIVYALISDHPVEYARKHMLELIICVAWIPHYSEGALKHLAISRILSIDMLQLIGSLAHGWRVVKWTSRRFSDHPVIVTGSAALLLVISAAALLNHFEPQTFHTFWDGAWYSLVTITTIGYGDLVPHTSVGRAIGAVLIVSGVALAGVFLGLISQAVHKRLVKKGKKIEHALLPFSNTGETPDEELQQQILIELRTNNELIRQLLEEHRQAHGVQVSPLSADPRKTGEAAILTPGDQPHKEPVE